MDNDELIPSTLRRLIERPERFRLVADGRLAVFTSEGRVFLYNRETRDAFEVRPDYDSGITTNYIGKG